MKKAYIGLLTLAGVVLLTGLVYIVSHGYNTPTSSAECTSIAESELDSERSQGLVVKNKQLLVVRLKQESNYSVPGGHVDFGENPQQALARELKEEVGIKAKISGFKYYRTDCEPKNGKTQRVYYYLVEDWEDNISLEDSKDKVKWVNYEYESSKKADTDVKLALHYLKQDGLIE